ncbi:helix-turn-helix domain-containing protein [Sciscionella sediminilitoris]|uniref:helix-turn-helix domain-containing protein n=1 Tax=Sciscionella sediminilitoris TaxID=1445613 RepID=UPI001E500362|nr:AraC family transcriptional regulator [Sciscionella sp. SE31]
MRHSQVDRNTRLAAHRHRHHLIVGAASATVTVRTGDRDRLVPPAHALWLPSGTSHAVAVLHPGDSYVVAVDTERCPIDWPDPTGIRITGLIRELIAYLGGETCPEHTRAGAESVLLDLLEPASGASPPAPLPSDPRIRAIADALLANPADQRDLATWGHEVGAGVRTLTRLFAAETGMSFARWRTHVRIRAAFPRLAKGASVGATARAVGYRKPGAFSEAFFRVTGQSPSDYRP